MVKECFNPQNTTVLNTAQAQFSDIIAALFNLFTIPHGRQINEEKSVTTILNLVPNFGFKPRQNFWNA